MIPTPVPRPPSRRSVLRGGLAALGAAGLAGAAGCGRDRGPDPLEALLADAGGDAAAAFAAAADQRELTATMHTVGGVRRAHAERLRAEILRVRPDREEALPALPAAPAAPGAPPPGRTAPAVTSAAAGRRELTGRLATASTRAAGFAAGAERTRAGLAAAVAGSCAGCGELLA